MKNCLILTGRVQKAKKDGFVTFYPSDSMIENQYVRVSSSLRDVPFDKEVNAIFSLASRIGLNSFKQPCQFFAAAELVAFDAVK